MRGFPRQDPSPLPAVTVRRVTAFIAGLYLIVALAYGATNPLFEAPDEHWHYFTAQSIAENWRLPRVEEPPDSWLGQEAAQPPLYYMLGALLIAPLDTSGARETVWLNPRVEMGDASATSNINAFVHGEWEAWPWCGYVLAAHLLRVFSSLLGLGTLLFIYGSARQLWPARPHRALLAMAMVAFLPQFLFIHSAVTNDALITVLCAAALWQLLRLWRGGFQKRAMVLLGITIGLAILSKTAGLLLLAFACAVLLLRSLWHGDDLRSAVLEIPAFVALPALLIGGWHLLRNWTLYGDPTAANQFVAIAGGDRAYSIFEVLAESDGLWTSFFAMFGWFNVRAPDWVYWLWNGIVLLAAGGAAWAVIRKRRQAANTIGVVKSRRASDQSIIVLWLALWLLLIYAGLVAFMLRTPAAQGRLLFPALVPIALGLSFGLDQYHRLRLLWPILALATSLAGLLLVIPNAYRQPLALPAGDLPPDVTPLQATLDEGMALLGYRLQTPQVHPGDTVRMELYWRTSRPEGARDDAPQLVVELLGRDETLVGKFQGYHGRGLYPATLWPQDRIVMEQVVVPLVGTMDVPTTVRVQLGLAPSARRETVAILEVEPEQWPDAPDSELAQLGNGISLVEATFTPQQISPGDVVNVSLSWHVHQDVQTSYTTFVHLGEPTATPLAQGDGPPLDGSYPTEWWEAGEVITADEYDVWTSPALAAGRYPLWVGLYDGQSGQRLPLFAGGERQAHDAYLVGWVVVN